MTKPDRHHLQQLVDLASQDAIWAHVDDKEIPVIHARLAHIQQVLMLRLLKANSSDKASMEPLLTLAEASSMLHVAPDYFYRHWRKIPGSCKIAGKLRFSEDGLRRWVQENGAGSGR